MVMIAGKGGLAAAGFADDRQRLACSTEKLTPSSALTVALAPNERRAAGCSAREVRGLDDGAHDARSTGAASSG